MKWFHFMDMHSGGRCKEPPYEHFFIEAPDEEVAILAFYKRYGHNPNRVSCTCCGEDYSISDYATLEDATSYYRERDDQTLTEYVKKPYVCVIRWDEIPLDHRYGSVPTQGFVWQD